MLFVFIILHNTLGLSHLESSGFVDFHVFLLQDERMGKIMTVLRNARVPLDVLKTTHLHARGRFSRLVFYFLDAPRTCMGR